MTRLLNDPNDVIGEATTGLVAEYGDLLARVTGGVVRSQITRPGKIAVVTGGGSGHYPAFAGWVGTGLADGAVIGTVFASPSSQQICAVAGAGMTTGADAALDAARTAAEAVAGLTTTLVDALGPFVAALAERPDTDQPCSDAWAGAADQAESTAQATSPLRPRIGRTRVLADRSVGHPDPGAVSLTLVLRTAARA